MSNPAQTDILIEADFPSSELKSKTGDTLTPTKKTLFEPVYWMHDSENKKDTKETKFEVKSEIKVQQLFILDKDLYEEYSQQLAIAAGLFSADPELSEHLSRLQRHYPDFGTEDCKKRVTLIYFLNDLYFPLKSAYKAKVNNTQLAGFIQTFDKVAAKVLCQFVSLPLEKRAQRNLARKTLQELSAQFSKSQKDLLSLKLDLMTPHVAGSDHVARLQPAIQSKAKAPHPKSKTIQKERNNKYHHGMPVIAVSKGVLEHKNPKNRENQKNQEHQKKLTKSMLNSLSLFIRNDPETDIAGNIKKLLILFVQFDKNKAFLRRIKSVMPLVFTHAISIIPNLEFCSTCLEQTSINSIDAVTRKRIKNEIAFARTIQPFYTETKQNESFTGIVPYKNSTIDRSRLIGAEQKEVLNYIRDNLVAYCVNAEGITADSSVLSTFNLFLTIVNQLPESISHIDKRILLASFIDQLFKNLLFNKPNIITAELIENFKKCSESIEHVRLQSTVDAVLTDVAKLVPIVKATSLGQFDEIKHSILQENKLGLSRAAKQSHIDIVDRARAQFESRQIVAGEIKQNESDTEANICLASRTLEFRDALILAKEEKENKQLDTKEEQPDSAKNHFVAWLREQQWVEHIPLTLKDEKKTSVAVHDFKAFELADLDFSVLSIRLHPQYRGNIDTENFCYVLLAQDILLQRLGRCYRAAKNNDKDVTLSQTFQKLLHHCKTSQLFKQRLPDSVPPELRQPLQMIQFREQQYLASLSLENPKVISSHDELLFTESLRIKHSANDSFHFSSNEYLNGKGKFYGHSMPEKQGVRLLSYKFENIEDLYIDFLRIRIKGQDGKIYTADHYKEWLLLHNESDRKKIYQSKENLFPDQDKEIYKKTYLFLHFLVEKLGISYEQAIEVGKRHTQELTGLAEMLLQGACVLDAKDNFYSTFKADEKSALISHCNGQIIFKSTCKNIKLLESQNPLKFTMLNGAVVATLVFDLDENNGFILKPEEIVVTGEHAKEIKQMINNDAVLISGDSNNLTVTPTTKQILDLSNIDVLSSLNNRKFKETHKVNIHSGVEKEEIPKDKNLLYSAGLLIKASMTDRNFWECYRKGKFIIRNHQNQEIAYASIKEKNKRFWNIHPEQFLRFVANQLRLPLSLMSLPWSESLINSGNEVIRNCHIVDQNNREFNLKTAKTMISYIPGSVTVNIETSDITLESKGGQQIKIPGKLTMLAIPNNGKDFRGFARVDKVLIEGRDLIEIVCNDLHEISIPEITFPRAPAQKFTALFGTARELSSTREDDQKETEESKETKQNYETLIGLVKINKIILGSRSFSEFRKTPHVHKDELSSAKRDEVLARLAETYVDEFITYLMIERGFNFSAEGECKETKKAQSKVIKELFALHEQFASSAPELADFVSQDSKLMSRPQDFSEKFVFDAKNKGIKAERVKYYRLAERARNDRPDIPHSTLEVKAKDLNCNMVMVSRVTTQKTAAGKVMMSPVSAELMDYRLAESWQSNSFKSSLEACAHWHPGDGCGQVYDSVINHLRQFENPLVAEDHKLTAIGSISDLLQGQGPLLASDDRFALKPGARAAICSVIEVEILKIKLPFSGSIDLLLKVYVEHYPTESIVFFTKLHEQGHPVAGHLIPQKVIKLNCKKEPDPKSPESPEEVKRGSEKPPMLAESEAAILERENQYLEAVDKRLLESKDFIEELKQIKTECKDEDTAKILGKIVPEGEDRKAPTIIGLSELMMEQANNPKHQALISLVMMHLGNQASTKTAQLFSRSFANEKLLDGFFENRQQNSLPRQWVHDKYFVFDENGTVADNWNEDTVKKVFIFHLRTLGWAVKDCSLGLSHIIDQVLRGHIIKVPNAPEFTKNGVFDWSKVYLEHLEEAVLNKVDANARTAFIESYGKCQTLDACAELIDAEIKKYKPPANRFSFSELFSRPKPSIAKVLKEEFQGNPNQPIKDVIIKEAEKLYQFRAQFFEVVTNLL